jgi:hypothetical protein
MVLGFRLRHDDLLAPVEPALMANPMGKNPIAAVAALDQGRSDKLHIDGLPTPSSGFGRLKFRNCHIKTSLASNYP